MKTELLQIEVELLLLKYGEPSVVKALALSLNSTEEELRTKTNALRARKIKAPRTPRVKKTPLDTAKEVVSGRANEDLLTKLAILFQNKQFLPQLKDVKRFLGRFNITKKIKSRNDGARSVFEALCQITRDELSDMLSDSSSGDQSSFAMLADHIIGGRGKESSNK